ncbi:hypothetical protein NPIL_94291 [Nephila pilipes]|uniref:Uncharacterized protein n=1 Tax=Nephila pilipes TaxID=299642 RepID=A0A8X6QX33_NEPPI|nr:hypothetical protein NPIL_94291 [Nephila pilipes]
MEERRVVRVKRGETVKDGLREGSLHCGLRGGSTPELYGAELSPMWLMTTVKPDGVTLKLSPLPYSQVMRTGVGHFREEDEDRFYIAYPLLSAEVGSSKCCLTKKGPDEEWSPAGKWGRI